MVVGDSWKLTAVFLVRVVAAVVDSVADLELRHAVAVLAAEAVPAAAGACRTWRRRDRGCNMTQTTHFSGQVS